MIGNLAVYGDNVRKLCELRLKVKARDEMITKYF